MRRSKRIRKALKRKLNQVDVDSDSDVCNVDLALVSRKRLDLDRDGPASQEECDLSLEKERNRDLEDSQNSSIMDSCEREPISPLNIPLIISTILKYLDVKELIKDRLVCRLWGEEAIKCLESRAKILTSLTSNFSFFIDEMKTRARLEMAMSSNSPSQEYYVYRKISSELSIASFKTFNIKLLHTLGGGRFIEELFKALGAKINFVEMSLEIGSQQTIWKILHRNTPNLSSVTISLSNDSLMSQGYRTSMHQDFFREALVKLPTVKSLRLIEDIHDLQDAPLQIFLLPTENSNAIQRLAFLLLKIFPNLEIFHINCRQADYGHMISLLTDNAIEDDFENPNPHIKALEFPLNLNEEEVSSFQEKLKYPLEKLKLSLRPGLRFPALYSWLSSLGPTLTSLDLDFVLIPPSPESFPCGSDLLNVKHLKLKSYYGPLDFVKYMKNMQSLSLTNINLSVAFQNEPDSSCENLSSLELINSSSNAGRVIFPVIFRTITKFFPGLRKLRADHLSDTNLKTVLRGCPKIEQLFLVDSLITDEALTGLSTERCSALEKITETAIQEELELAAEDNSKYLSGEPRISDLQNLKKLHISSSRISDVSIFFEITCCQNLEDFCVSSRLITSKILCHAVRKMRLKQLRISRCYRIENSSTNLFPKDEDCISTVYPVLLLDGKCQDCGISETD